MSCCLLLFQTRVLENEEVPVYCRDSTIGCGALMCASICTSKSEGCENPRHGDQWRQCALRSMRVCHLPAGLCDGTKPAGITPPHFNSAKVEFRAVLSPASSELKFKSLRTAFLCLSLSELGSDPKPPVIAAISAAVCVRSRCFGGGSWMRYVISVA